jgi:hypothetical protein
MPREKMAWRLAQERCAAMSEKRSSTMTLKNRAYATSEESPITSHSFCSTEFRRGAGFGRNKTIPTTLAVAAADHAAQTPTCTQSLTHSTNTKYDIDVMPNDPTIEGAKDGE